MEVRCNEYGCYPDPTTRSPREDRENYLNKEYGVWSWLLTTDHKRIALLYLISITFFFFIGGFFASAHSPGVAHPGRAILSGR